MGIQRKTKSLALILNEFEQKQGAISVTELIKKLGDEMNKTTIYRVLERLEDDGVVHSFIGESGIKWYAKCNNCTHHAHKDVHPHFQCVRCGNTNCLEVNYKFPEIDGYKIETVNLLLIGTCKDCL
ncbi:Fur family transcriptional regulator [Tenacibaculum geojense]|uniref:Ferric uptake regulation protein n=1 Tax=Tenacibaculum geojense TaxID=915352 RepID=A0ABW3JR02_9FLAO